MKSVFLERFTRFITWPQDDSVNDPSEPFIIGILGENPFGTLLHEIYSEQKINDKRAEIRHYTSTKEITGCNLLFISQSEERRLERILSELDSFPILTVGDTDGYADRGIMINMYLDEGKVRFEVNRSALEKAELKVSHLLLKSARIVD